MKGLIHDKNTLQENTIQVDYNNAYIEATTLLKKLIRNKCVNYDTPGSGFEIRSVNTLVDYFSSHGIDDYQIFEPIENRGNLLVKIKGSDTNAPSLMYQSHLDVVPANEGEWDVDPFAGVEKDGFLWGRGAVDMLIYSATQAAAFANLISSGWKPKGDFYYLAVADEEGGGDYGAKWLVENVPDKIRADYLISEFGGTTIDTPKGPKIGLMIAEKGPGWSRINIKGTPTHASLPYKADNAVIKLGKILNKLENNPPGVKITPEWKHFVNGLELNWFSQFLLTHRGTVDLAIRMVERTEPGLAKALHALTRMTISPTITKSGSKVNVISDKAELTLDIRLLPGQNYDDFLDYMRDTLGMKLFEDINIEQIVYHPGSSDPWDDKLVQTIIKTHEKIDTTTKVEPMILPAVTDARFFRKIGIKCYGFCELTDEVDLTMLMAMAHGNNERVPLKAIEKSTEFYTCLAYNFL